MNSRNQMEDRSASARRIRELQFLGNKREVQLTTPENTITYHNALCLSPQNFA